MTAESDAEKLRRRNHELSILNEIAQTLNRSVDLDQALRTALAQMVELLQLHTGWVWLLHEETGESYLAASQHLPPALADRPQLMEGGCTCLSMYRDDELTGAANTDVILCSRLHGLVDGTDGLRYHASIPLYVQSKKLGVMNVASPDWRELSAADLKLLYTIGDLLGIAIERARLFDRSAEMGALRERNRLAREIHDTLAQGLTAVSLQLESADELLEAGSDNVSVRSAVQHALDLTRANLEEARRSVMDLRAAPLEGRTLSEALNALAAETGVSVNCEIVGDDRPLPHRIEAGLYRIAQEALANVEQHARATHVHVQMVTTPSEIRLTIEDNGRGFNVDEVDGDRFGLVGMSERAHLMDGKLLFESSLEEGTRIEVFVPLRRREFEI